MPRPLKPRLFIASSGEALGIVTELRNYLSEYCEVVPWNTAKAFKERNAPFEALLQAANEFDFAVMVFARDDTTSSRDNTDVPSPRDNVVFEMGLFLGALGPDRVMPVIEENDDGIVDLKIPSDVVGRGIPRFRTKNAAILQSTINDVCEQLGHRIKKHKRREIKLPLAREWWFDSTDQRFFVKLSSANLLLCEDTIGQRGLAVVARFLDLEIEADRDRSIARSTVKRVPSQFNDEILFSIPAREFARIPKGGDKIQAYILLVPEGADISTYNTMEEMCFDGFYQVERVSSQLGDCNHSDCPLFQRPS